LPEGEPGLVWVGHKKGHLVATSKGQNVRLDHTGASPWAYTTVWGACDGTGNGSCPHTEGIHRVRWNLDPGVTGLPIEFTVVTHGYGDKSASASDVFIDNRGPRVDFVVLGGQMGSDAEVYERRFDSMEYVLYTLQRVVQFIVIRGLLQDAKMVNTCVRRLGRGMQ